jgi:MFS family permease
VSTRDRGWSARSIIGLCTLIFAQTFSIGAYPTIVPEMARTVGLSDWQLGTVAGMLGFTRLAFALPVGLMVSRHLRAPLIVAPFLLCGGVLCLATGWSFVALALGRFAMGVAHSLVMIGGLTAVLHHNPARTLGAALNAFELSAMLGMLGGVTLAGSLPSTLAWNHAYLVACTPQLLGVLVLPFLLASLPRRAAAVPRRPAQAADERASRAGAGLTPLVVLAFATGATVSGTWSTLEQFTIPLRATGEFGLGRAGVAPLFMTMQLCDIAMLLPMGLVADRLPKARVLGVVILMLGAGTLLVAFGDLTLLRLGCVVVGLGMAGWMLPLGVLRQETPPERIAWRTALYRVAVDGGIFFGPFLSGLIGRTHLGVLPAVTASALLVIGLTLLTTAGSATTAPAPERSAADG